MHYFLAKILEATILLVFCCSAIARQEVFLINVTNNARARENPIQSEKNALVYDGSDKSVTERSDRPRSYYSGVPATPYIPAFDPISVLASLAFLAFLLQSFCALLDRTRSIMPTIVSSRRSSSKYGEHFTDIEKRVLRALEEYASLSNDVLEDEKGNENHTS